MDPSSFDLLVRRLVNGPSRRRLLAQSLVGLAVPFTVTRLAPRETEARKGGKSKKRVTICRDGLTIVVSKKSLQKHLRRGATLGACQATSQPPEAPATPPVCTPACGGRSCGNDGCDGTCGECLSNQVCQDSNCCTPNCASRTCGDDGCGGSCGTCETDETCTNGRCQLTCAAGQAPCFNVCIPASCQSQCNEPCRVIGSSCCGPLSCQRSQTGQVSCRP
jgi:hypothetical protein